MVYDLTCEDYFIAGILYTAYKSIPEARLELRSLVISVACDVDGSTTYQINLSAWQTFYRELSENSPCGFMTLVPLLRSVTKKLRLMSLTEEGLQRTLRYIAEFWG